MSWLATILAVFVPALLLPGPDFLGVLRATIAAGRSAGLRAGLERRPAPRRLAAARPHP